MFQVSANVQQSTDFKQKNGKLRLPKRMFTADEDNKIKQLVRINGDKAWKIIARAFPNRSPRQCRERWKNYLSPTVRNLPWTPEEDNKLANLFDSYGTQWAKIASCFDARTDVNVKNRWSYLMRKEKRLTATSGDDDNKTNKKNDLNDVNNATSNSPCTSTSSPPQSSASHSFTSSIIAISTAKSTETAAFKSSGNSLTLLASGKKANSNNSFNSVDCSGRCIPNSGRAEMGRIAKVVEADPNKHNKSSDQLIDFWDSNWEITDDNNQPCF